MLNVAIHGLGNWGRKLVDSVAGSSKIRFVCGITRTPDKHQDYAAKTGLKLVTSYEAVLADKAIDAVVLATPHSHHEAQVIAAAKAGKPVYVEKPITLTQASAQRVVDATRAAGVTLGIGFNRRHAPSFLEMIKRIRAGEIGDVLHIEGHHSGPSGLKLKAGGWRANRIEAPGGGMTARGIHTLDSMLQAAGGLVTSVYAFSDRRKMSADIDMDDTSSMMLKFSNGVTGYLGVVFVTGELYRVHVFGSNGWLEMRGDTELVSCALEGKPQRHTFDAADKERALLEAFADGVAAKQPFMVAPEQAVNGIAVLESIERSAKSGQPVTIKI
jgi:predicted dehydrogenase